MYCLLSALCLAADRTRCHHDVILKQSSARKCMCSALVEFLVPCPHSRIRILIVDYILLEMKHGTSQITKSDLFRSIYVYTTSVKKQMFFTIPGGPLAYTSQHGPLPLCELERALLLAAGMGVTAGTLAFLLR